MADLDVVARLQLNAEQFSSETGQRFAEMKTRAASAASEIKASFGQSFADVNKIAQQALTLPRTSGGSLDLSGEIASLKAAAAEADQNAQALRELHAAQLAAAESGRGNADALKLDADASMVAIANQEKLAAETRERVGTLQQVQAELAKTASLTTASAAANDNEAQSTGRQSAAKMEFMHVFRSVGDSFAAGIPIQQIFAMELGRTIEAIGLWAGQAGRSKEETEAFGSGAVEAGGKAAEAGVSVAEAGEKVAGFGGAAASVAEFLSGPWGIAIVAGMAVLAPFVAKLFEGNDELGKAVDKLAKDAEQADIAREAHDKFTHTLAGEIAKQRELNDQLDREIRTRAQLNTDRVIDSNNSLSAAQKLQPELQAAYEEAKRQANFFSHLGGSVARASAEKYGREASEAKDKLDKNTSFITDTQRASREAELPNMKDDVAGQTDKATAATQAYTKAVGALDAEYARGDMTRGAYEFRLAQITKTEQAALEAARRKEPKARLGYKGEGDDLAIANAQAKVAEATNEVQKAEADLDLVRAEAKKQLDQHSISLATYTARVNAAAAAVKAAKEAEADKKAVVDWGAKYADPDLFLQAKKAPSLGDGDFDQDFKAQENARKYASDEAEQSMHHLAVLYQDLFTGNTKSIWSDFQKQGADALSAILAKETKSLWDSLLKVPEGKNPSAFQQFLKNDLGQGLGYGAVGGSVFASITGGKQDPLASGIGGTLGDVAGKALGKTLAQSSSSLLSALGGAAGPIGAVVGGVLGNVLGGLFSSPKWANAQVGLNAYGSATGGAGSGNGSAAVQAATGESSSVAAAINQIAQQLGATITSLPALTLGTFNGNYRVATTSTTASLNYNNFGHDVLQDFGGDQQAAIEYAARYSICHAVISGISDASKKILADGSEDLQSALTKAMEIEAVPKDLKAMLDPVGAAIDALNLKWQQTVSALKEGGATAAQMAQAQQLYNLQLDQAKNSTDAADQALKDFLTSLKVGSDSPYSLRDQETAAKAALQPFLDQIGAGQTIDQSKFQTAAKSYLDVERNLYGSTQGYFDAQDLVQSAVNQAISTIDNAVPVTAAVADPFAQATANSTASTADNTATGNDLLSQLAGTMGNVQDLLSTIAANTAGGGSSFIGAGRGFVLAA